MTMNLKKLYNDPKFAGSFGGVDRFYQEVKKLYPNVTKSKIKYFLETENAYTLHKDVRKPKRYRRVFTKSIDYLWQADLLDMQAHSEVNDGYRYINTIIDTFSKQLYMIALKSKTGIALTNAMKFLIIAKKPQYLQVDLGTEFYNTNFKNMLAHNNVKMYSTHSPLKTSIVERVQRTIRNRLWAYFTLKGSYRWIDVLDDIVYSYNHSKHRSIGMAPADVTISHERMIHSRLFPKRSKNRPKFKIGDSVRISKIRQTFQKSAVQNWSDEVFQIVKIKDTNPITYNIKDYTGDEIKGMFYAEELQKVHDVSYHIEKVITSRRYKGKKQHLVKFKGYTDTYWIQDSELIQLK